jgi:hypothetical protein
MAEQAKVKVFVDAKCEISINMKKKSFNPGLQDVSKAEARVLIDAKLAKSTEPEQNKKGNK